MPPAASFLEKAWQKLSKIKSINALSAKMMQKTQTGKLSLFLFAVFEELEKPFA